MGGRAETPKWDITLERCWKYIRHWGVTIINYMNNFRSVMSNIFKIFKISKFGENCCWAYNFNGYIPLYPSEWLFKIWLYFGNRSFYFPVFLKGLSYYIFLKYHLKRMSQFFNNYTRMFPQGTALDVNQCLGSISFLFLVYSEALDKSLHLSEPRFPHLQHWANDRSPAGSSTHSTYYKDWTQISSVHSGNR